ncbi:MAG: CAP domain-containing protein [Elainellaceae cyanobacterium]
MSTVPQPNLWKRLSKRLSAGAIALALLACSSQPEQGPTPAEGPTAGSSEATAPNSASNSSPAGDLGAAAGNGDGGADSEAGDGSADAALAALEDSVLAQINQYRQEQGLAPLATNEAIRQQARQHSSAMAQGEVPFSHEGFEQRVAAIAKSIDYRRSAENVAYNEGYAQPGEQAVQGWLESPGHLSNIRGDYGLTGVGIARDGQAYYFTQIFILTP